MRENGTNKNTFWFISDHTARVYLAAWGKQKTHIMDNLKKMPTRDIFPRLEILLGLFTFVFTLLALVNRFYFLYQKPDNTTKKAIQSYLIVVVPFMCIFSHIY